MKTIPKKKMEKDYIMVQRELELLRDLDHPNVIKFYECYQDSLSFHFVMEYCSGGELTDRVANKSSITEAETAKIMSKAFSAVNYIHEKGIVHRDIKPDNFLYASKDPDAEIKLIDFGLSRYFAPHQLLESQVGTPYYIAPDVIMGDYDYRCDYWSLGVMMFVLLAGRVPFDGPNTLELAKEILTAQPNLKAYPWMKISKEAKDLVSRLLEKDANKRITAKEALQHPWIKRVQSKHTLQNEEASQVIENLKRFSRKQKFKKEVLDILITQLKETELKKLKQAFKYFDKRNNGRITIADLKQVVKEQKLNISQEQLEEIIQSLGMEDTRTIGFTQFMVAAMDSKLYMTKEMLAQAFAHFDTDGSGYIDAKDLKEVMTRAAKQMSHSEIQEMIVEADTSKDGRISFEEFCNMMGVEALERDLSAQRKEIEQSSKLIPIRKFHENPHFFQKDALSQSIEKLRKSY